MSSVSAYEAKTHLSRLLERAARGDEITITRHGRPVAKLVPATPAHTELSELTHEMRAFRAALGDDHVDVRSLVEEGRRH
ncbi:type II toxin-antitoxin system prevent-host-death family antitoxin [Microbacterium sp. ET2]|uniref:type II toxin-antitoxin system Phd/YefM family antitoxin n=1 Tax=Microbacterium albipurpureum TaxID=3050384 RepID=UPI00259C948A|nr:type II toxin-antitoxin system prevent-host-death family antitoxin [Microbacterium sp. ET2 (Ac-2212)]WJL94716.1 type II toxin-antitoxin system prevent-host-death family antitoxin [Microbacterium sp. ET2 (Ac-2212)]